LDFVQYHGTIYSKLEQVSKATPAAKKWFEQKRSERKTDDLLKYLHHARNVGEHTILKAAGQAVFAVSGRLLSEGATLGICSEEQGNLSAAASGAGDLAVHENEILLLAATDRGVVYAPPRQHLGQSIRGDTANEVATLGLQYAEAMLKEAGTLDPPV
jgi:hypothetical protein